MSPNMGIASNVVMTYYDEDWNVLHEEAFHNLIVNSGLEWFLKQSFGVLVGANPIIPTGFFIKFGTGDTNLPYPPGGIDFELRGGTADKYEVVAAEIDFTAPGIITIRMTIPTSNMPAPPMIHIREIGVFATDGNNDVLLSLSSGPNGPNYDNSADPVGPVSARIQFQLVNG